MVHMLFSPTNRRALGDGNGDDPSLIAFGGAVEPLVGEPRRNKPRWGPGAAEAS